MSDTGYNLGKDDFSKAHNAQRGQADAGSICNAFVCLAVLACHFIPSLPENPGSFSMCCPASAQKGRCGSSLWFCDGHSQSCPAYVVSKMVAWWACRCHNWCIAHCLSQTHYRLEATDGLCLCCLCVWGQAQERAALCLEPFRHWLGPAAGPQGTPSSPLPATQGLAVKAGTTDCPSGASKAAS